ncbi:MAG TPA: choice-of-anchor B family protein [Tepidisphaeraceae bacterium]|nr:choice-of-anchor B family protein [Tepidisphaeraceae bacterium]
MRISTLQLLIGTALTVTAQKSLACGFEHGDTSEFGKHADKIALRGFTEIDPVVAAASAYNAQFLSQLTLPEMGGGQGSSLWGWTDPQTNREYAIMGRTTGTSFVDVTDPFNPVLVANMAPTAGTSATFWREPKVVGNHAYIGVDSTNHGIQVLDLTRLRTYAGTTLSLTPNTTFTGVQRAHTLGINAMGGVAQTSPDGQKYIFSAGGTEGGIRRGIRAINVTNPTAPVLAGAFQADGYTHEMQVVTYNGPDAAYAGSEIAFAFNEDTLTIVNVTNKSAMMQVARRPQPNAGYVHQGWLTADQKYLISNDETDERNGLTGGQTRTHFWDVSDLDNPVYKGFYNHALGSVDHNLYVVGNYVIQSNYTSGLRMFKLGDLNNTDPQTWLELVASFDTFAASDAATFDGAWNNYPFFKSGNIPISDINGGLIMVRPLVRGYQDYWLQQSLQSPTGNSEVPEPAAMTIVAAVAMAALRRRRGC